MCNLHSITKGQAAILAWARAMRDATGNLPPISGVFPDYFAAIRNAPDGVRELALARWGCGDRQRSARSTMFRFLTTEANAEVGMIHPKTTPVILIDQDEIETWMVAPAQEALRLQRPLPEGVLRVVATGQRRDSPIEAALNAGCELQHQQHLRRPVLKVFRTGAECRTPPLMTRSRLKAALLKILCRR